MYRWFLLFILWYFAILKDGEKHKFNLIKVFGALDSFESKVYMEMFLFQARVNTFGISSEWKRYKFSEEFKSKEVIFKPLVNLREMRIFLNYLSMQDDIFKIMPNCNAILQSS